MLQCFLVCCLSFGFVVQLVFTFEKLFFLWFLSLVLPLKRSFPTKITETLDFCFLLVILWFHMFHPLIHSSRTRWCVFSLCVVVCLSLSLSNLSHSIYCSTLPTNLMRLLLVFPSIPGFMTDTTKSLEKTLGKNFTSRYKNFPNKWHLRYKIIRGYPCSPEVPCCTAVTAEWPSAGLCK